MGFFKKNKFLAFTLVAAVIVFSTVAFVLLSVTATTKAAVLNQDVKAGTTITTDMVEEIDVPKDTPGDFIKDKDAVIGQRLSNNISAKQLLYSSDLTTAIEDLTSENDEYITCSFTVRDVNALGGMLSAGDKVDISVMIEDQSQVQKFAAAINDDATTSWNNGFYYVLANVTLVDATTAVSTDQGSNLSAVSSSGSESNASTSDTTSTYLVSISYNDYKKLRIAQEYGELALNLCPSQNNTYAPMLEAMNAEVNGALTDSSPSKISNKKSSYNTYTPGSSDESTSAKSTTGTTSTTTGTSSTSSTMTDEEATTSTTTDATSTTSSNTNSDSSSSTTNR